jgi:hypothetical protein
MPQLFDATRLLPGKRNRCARRRQFYSKFIEVISG